MNLLVFMEHHDGERWVTDHRWVRTPNGWRPTHPIYNVNNPAMPLCGMLCADMPEYLLDTPDITHPRALPGVPPNACSDTERACQTYPETSVSWITAAELLHYRWFLPRTRVITGTPYQRGILEATGIATCTRGVTRVSLSPEDQWGSSWLIGALRRVRDSAAPMQARLITVLTTET